jgi:hypothetical protein
LPLCAGIKTQVDVLPLLRQHHLGFPSKKDSERIVYNTYMEDTPPPSEPNTFGQPRFDVDLKPMYALTEQQYQAIINQLSNLLFAVIEQSKHASQGQLAEQVAHYAYDILQDYDDDVAEIMLSTSHLPQHHG